MSEEPRSKGKNGDAEERRGQAKQRAKRTEEYSVRIDAVKYLRCLTIEGLASGEVAHSLAISPRTLRHWDLMERRGELQPLHRGRPLVRSGREVRNRVVLALEYFGPRTGVATIRRFVPDVPRSEVRDIVVRYRERLKTRGEGVQHELRWRVPGAVQAFDHTVPPVLVDGSKPAILAGRDLATGETTLWQAVDGMTASTTVDLFRRSFDRREPPLVVKTDNGSAFIADQTEALLDAYEIEHLLSPPLTPRYNGSAERTIGWMKIRTAWHALREGRVDTWTSDDLAAAQDAANATRPSIRFESVPALTPAFRAAFRATVSAERTRLWAERGLDPAPVTKNQKNQINRQAITHALVAHGILEVRSRRVSLPVRSLFLAKIT